MHSTREHPEIIREYLAKECAEGRILGPFPPASLPGVQVSRFGVIPKKGLNKWRPILDLSSKEGWRINDDILPELCSLSCVSIDNAARAMARVGRGALLAKYDIKSSYRIVGVHPADRLLLGTLWDEELYVDTALPFGLRSAPKIFTALADALEWVVRQTGVKVVLHCLDDFLLVGKPASEQCKDNLQKTACRLHRSAHSGGQGKTRRPNNTPLLPGHRTRHAPQPPTGEDRGASGPAGTLANQKVVLTYAVCSNC